MEREKEGEKERERERERRREGERERERGRDQCLFLVSLFWKSTNFLLRMRKRKMFD